MNAGGRAACQCLFPREPRPARPGLPWRRPSAPVQGAHGSIPTVPPGRIRLPPAPGEAEPPSPANLFCYQAPLQAAPRTDATRPAAGARGPVP